MSNFSAIYDKILEKASKSNDKTKNKIKSALVESIRKNKDTLLKQYNIFEAIKNTSFDDKDSAKEFISEIEQYASKLDYDDLERANKELAEAFNIDISKIKSNKTDYLIDKLLRHKGGGIANLKEGINYKNEIANIILKENSCDCDNKQELPEFKNLSKTFALKYLKKKRDEKYNNLSESEKKVYDIVRKKDTTAIQDNLNLVEHKNSKLKLKKNQNKLVKETVKKLRENVGKNENIKESARKSVELLEQLRSLMEKKTGGAKTIKLGDFNTIQKAILETDENSNMPDMVNVDFQVAIYPISPNWSGLMEELEEIEKWLKTARREVFNILRKDFNDTFSKDVIVSTSIRDTGLNVGDSTTAKISINLYPVQSEEEYVSLDELQKPIEQLIRTLERGFYNPKEAPILDKGESKKARKALEDEAEELSNSTGDDLEDIDVTELDDFTDIYDALS